MMMKEDMIIVYIILKINHVQEGVGLFCFETEVNTEIERKDIQAEY